MDPKLVEQLPAVEAELCYLAPSAEKPYLYTYDPPPGEPRALGDFDPRAVAIHDARGVERDLSLDSEGFALLHHRSAVQGFEDEDEIRTVYYRETEDLIRKRTGADRVVVYDHTIRRRLPGAEDRVAPERQPVARVHVDQTFSSGPQRVRDLFPEEADALLRGRVRIINLWRPIRGPVKDSPLAMCDYGSVSEADLIPLDLIYADRRGEIYSLAYNPAHRWLYLKDMVPEEALLIKCYDSETDGRARFTPHAAFTDRTAPPETPPRQSIELRALVFGGN